MDSPTGRVPRSEDDTRDDQPRMQYPRREAHPKDRDIPGFTRDSMGRPKPGYHSPSGVSGVDIDQDAAARSGLADYIGSMMYGQQEWEERRKRTKREQRVKSVLKLFFTAGCFVISALLVVAAVLGLILLVSWLVSLL